MKKEVLCHIDFRRDSGAWLEWVPLLGRATGVGAYSTFGNVATHPAWTEKNRFSRQPDGLRLRGGSLLGGWFSARGSTEIVLTPGEGVVEVSFGRSVRLEQCATLDFKTGHIQMRTLARKYKKNQAKAGHYTQHLQVLERTQAKVQLHPHKRIRLVVHNNRTSIILEIDGRAILKTRVATRCGGVVAIFADDALLHTFKQTELRTEKEYASYRKHMEETKKLFRRISRSHREDLESHLQIQRMRGQTRLLNDFAGSEITWDPRGGRIISARSGGPADLVELVTRPFPEMTVLARGRRYVLGREAASGFKMDHLGASWKWRLNETGGGSGILDAWVSLRFHLNGLIVWEITPSRKHEGEIEWQIDVRLSSSLRYKDRCDWLFPDNDSEVAIVDSDLAHNVNGQCTLHDGKHGFSLYLDGYKEERMREVPAKGKRGGRITAMTRGGVCRFYTILSPHQKFTAEPFSKRIVHWSYRDWGKAEQLDPGVTSREFPSREKLKRFRKAGANCIVLHQSWMAVNETVWADLETSEKNMDRLRRDCAALGLELVVYISPRWLPVNDPGLSWRFRHVPPYFFDGPGEQKLCYLGYAESATAVHWLHSERVLRRYMLDGVYLDGGQSIDWAASTDPQLDRAEKEGYIERSNRQMYGLWRLVRDVNGRFGLEGYGESSGPIRCAYQSSRIYGESRDVFTPEMMRNHNNGVLNSGQFNFWGWNASARKAYNFGVCAVSLADMCMVVGNSYGADAGTSEEWDRLVEYWDFLGRVDFENLIEMQPWWNQSTVRVSAYAATYRWPGHCLVFLFSRNDSMRDIKVRFNFPRMGMKHGQVRVHRLRPRLKKPLRLDGGGVALRLPRQENGYAALWVEEL